MNMQINGPDVIAASFIALTIKDFGEEFIRFLDGILALEAAGKSSPFMLDETDGVFFIERS